jgi:hypothetical protein
VLEHADARHPVEQARNVAIALYTNLDSILWACRFDRLGREIELVWDNVTPPQRAPNFRAARDDQRAPAAPDIEKRLARLELNFGVDVVDLVLLGRRQSSSPFSIKAHA